MEQNTTIIKKSKLGVIGLILSLTVLLSLGLTAIPTIIVCIVGLFKPRQRTLPCVGLVITLISLFSLMIIFITFLPPNWTPAFLNTYKYKRACPAAAFWLNYDNINITDVHCQNTIIIERYGAIKFKSQPGTYQQDDIIKYATNNGWIYHLSLPLYKKDFEKYDSNLINSENEEDLDLGYVLDGLYQSPIILKDDCVILCFETESVLGYASFAIISKDKSTLLIYYTDPILPDSSSGFRLPYGFEELSKQRSSNLQEDSL